MMPREHKRKHDHEAMYADRLAGMTYSAIAEKHGCQHNVVWQACQHAARPDPGMESILTAAFRKVMGYCPVADGVRE